MGTSAREAGTQIGMGYPAALKLYDIIRITILHKLAGQDRILRGQIEADGRILEAGERETVVVVQETRPSSLAFCKGEARSLSA
jgi:hypothetical protein